MTGQSVPNITFGEFVIEEIPELLTKGELFINKEYQRGDIWKAKQKIELINSIRHCYSIGVLVLYINEKGKFEILDGQQRLQTIRQYLSDKLKLDDTGITKYSELSRRERTKLNAYCVYYLKLESHDPDRKEEDIIQVFLRLQEGTPLNKAEKLNAHRGAFKDAFREIRETHRVFTYLGKERRMRFRQLAAELLTLELEGDFKNRVFPALDLSTMLDIVKKYEPKVSKRKLKFFNGNLDFLEQSLNIILTAFKPSHLISFYLLISYLRKNRADNQDLINEFAEFARKFMQNLNKFSIYDEVPPDGMKKRTFDTYKKYKLEAKIMTTPESLKNRFDIILSEFQRLYPYIKREHKRLHDTEQKRILYFRQKGLCAHCNKEMHFRTSSSHHIIAHSKGGKTTDLKNAILLHEKCHQKLEKRKTKKERKRPKGSPASKSKKLSGIWLRN